MTSRHTVFVPVSLTCALLLGCGAANNPPATPQAKEAGRGDEHAHSTHGPHGGDIIELGTEQFHAELVHDRDAGNVTIYMLDSTATQSAPIDAPEVSLNLRDEGKANQFKLAASPDEGDLPGNTSRFVSTEKELADELDHAHGQLVVMIAGTQYRGNIEHDHEHDGEQH